MLFTSAISVSRWRTPPIAAGSPSTRPSSIDPVRRVEVRRRPRGDLGLDVDQCGVERPVRLADEVGVEVPHDRVVPADRFEGDVRPHTGSSYSIQVERRRRSSRRGAGRSRCRGGRPLEDRRAAFAGDLGGGLDQRPADALAARLRLDVEVVHQHRLHRPGRGEVPVEAGVADQAARRARRRAASRRRWGRGSGGRTRGCAPRGCPRLRRSAGRRRSSAPASRTRSSAIGSILSSSATARSIGISHRQGRRAPRSKRPHHLLGRLAAPTKLGARRR